MGYSACFTIDVNMFWIFILFCFFPCSHKQLCLIKFLIFCTNSLSLFVSSPPKQSNQNNITGRLRAKGDNLQSTKTRPGSCCVS